MNALVFGVMWWRKQRGCFVLAMGLFMVAGPLCTASAQPTCLPWSVLGQLEGFSSAKDDLVRIGKIASGPAESSEILDELKGLVTREDVIGAEARCWERLLFGDPSKVWHQLAGLRLDASGLRVFNGLDAPSKLQWLTRFPTVYPWTRFSSSLTYDVLDEYAIHASTEGVNPEHVERLILRWPEIAHSWMSQNEGGNGNEVLRSALLQGFQTSAPEDVSQSLSKLKVLGVVRSANARSAALVTKLIDFLRHMMRENPSDTMLMSLSANQTIWSPQEMREQGFDVRVVFDVKGEIEPVARTRRFFPGTYYLTMRPSLNDSPHSLALSLNEEQQLRSLQDHKGGIPEPVVVLGRDSPRFQRWIRGLERLEGLNEVVLPVVVPKDVTDLSSQAKAVMGHKPGTLILAISHSDSDSFLRFLAQAGVWAKGSQEEVRPEEHHCLMLVPSSFAQDPQLINRNRHYLKGVEIVSDIPPLSDWKKIPVVKSFVREQRAYPPLLGLRVAAVLERLRHSQNSGDDASDPVDGTEPQWLEGQTIFGALKIQNGALTFPVQHYMFAAGRFQPIVQAKKAEVD